MENKPVVKLVEISGCSPEAFAKVWTIAKDDTPYEDIKPLSPELHDKFMSADIPPQEYINMIWSIEGMPRAFWDQLDRCRLASFWEQSARVIDLSTFAKEGRYWMSEQINADPLARKCYEETMRMIEMGYENLVNLGVPVEEARGVIPLHILTRGTMCINLRALKGLIKNRVCFVCQGSYWLPVIDGIIRELKNWIPERTLKSLVNLPCYTSGSCPIEGSVLQRISGEDPNPVCPVYVKRFVHKKSREVVEEKEIKRNPNYPKLKENYFKLLKKLNMDEGGESVES